MSNDLKIRPVKIKLDKERNLIFDLNAFEELENIYEKEPPIFEEDKDGKKIEVTSLLSKAFKYFSVDSKKIKHIKNFLYAGLVHEDETLTPTIVGTLISYNNLTKITDQIWQAITQEGLPEPKEGSGSNPGE